jgi:hypothetical protein
MLPGDIAPTVLVPGDPGRVELFAEHMDEAHKVAQNVNILPIPEKGWHSISCTSCAWTFADSDRHRGTDPHWSKEHHPHGTCGAIQPFMKAAISSLPPVQCARARYGGIHLHWLPCHFQHFIVRASIEACKRLGLTYHAAGAHARCLLP